MLAAVSLMEDPSDDDEPNHGGSRPGKAPNKARDFQAAYGLTTDLRKIISVKKTPSSMKETLNVVFECREIYSIAFAML